MKKSIFLILITGLISCSGVTGKYDQVNIGYLGMDNSVSRYEFGMFNSVEYALSTSGTRSNNFYKRHKGKFRTEGDKIIMNFGGSDRILKISQDGNSLTDDQGNVFKKP